MWLTHGTVLHCKSFKNPQARFRNVCHDLQLNHIHKYVGNKCKQNAWFILNNKSCFCHLQHLNGFRNVILYHVQSILHPDLFIENRTKTFPWVHKPWYKSGDLCRPTRRLCVYVTVSCLSTGDVNHQEVVFLSRIFPGETAWRLLLTYRGSTHTNTHTNTHMHKHTRTHTLIMCGPFIIGVRWWKHSVPVEPGGLNYTFHSEFQSQLFASRAANSFATHYTL